MEQRMKNHIIVSVLSALFCMLPIAALCATVRMGYFDIVYGDTIGENHLNIGINAGSIPPLTTPKELEFLNGYNITRVFNAEEKKSIELATSYFAEHLVGMPIPKDNALIYVGFVNDVEKSASSLSTQKLLIPQYADLFSANGGVYDIFMGQGAKRYPLTLADNVIIFNVDYLAVPTRLLLKENTVTATMMHEYGHALGITVSHEITGGSSTGTGTTGVFDAKSFTAWNSHLYDVFGVQAKPGMDIAMSVIDNTITSNPILFQVYAQTANPADYKYITFRGKNVNELTGELGMPVMGGFHNEGNDLDGANALGHPGVMNSIMSYGIVMNMPFTEMELAAFQDMGYTINRRDFFGKSYYYDVGGDDQINALGFGTAAAPNKATFGLGTHIMRNDLNLTQTGSIYVAGYGSGGVRIDGVSNTLSIPKGTAISATGEYGTGLLVSYGSNNTIRLNGSISATGVGGIGAHFGINASEPLHSYFKASSITDLEKKSIQRQYEFGLAEKELAGALVKNFTISGLLAGNQAAIQIERDSHVKDINILNGAKLMGNIIVRWDMWNLAPAAATVTDRMTDYGTNLNFGVTGDRTFNLYYTGTIDGRGLLSDSKFTTSALAINFKGGTTSINGPVYAYSATIDKGATLKGSSTYNLEQYDSTTGALIKGTLVNNGRFSPGNSIGTVTINGNYAQDGRLRMEFDGQGGHDVLVVTGTYTNTNPSGRGEALAPAKGYFPSGAINLNTQNMFKIGAAGTDTAPTFDRFLNSSSSPTLNFTALNLNTSMVTVQVSRTMSAYSRHATTSNANQVGRTLAGIAEVAHGDMQKLFEVLDFSSGDGSGISAALPQLTAAPYTQMNQASVEGNLNVGRTAVSHLRTAGAPMTAGRGKAGTTGLAGGDSAAQWSAFVMPFGGGSQQQTLKKVTGSNSAEVGLIGGVYRQTDNMTMNLYTGFSRRQVDMWTTAGAQSRSNALHVGAATLWQENQGSGWQLWLQAQLGLENTNMRRSVAFADYARENTSYWTSFNGMTALGGGYLWQIGEFSVGPQIGLEYAFNAMPAVEEKNGGATRLGMEAHIQHDVRGVAGLMAAWNTDIGQGRGLRASLEAVWRQDMLPPQQNVRTYFVGYSQYSFDTRTERNGQGSLGLTGGVQVNLRQDVTLSALLEADILRPGYTSLGGGLSLRWEF